MYTKNEAYQKIEELTIRFAEQIQSYKKSDYNETLVRRDFIDPFFKALGWDVDNSQGYAEAYREVIHEDKIKVGSATKAPDYSFRLPGGKRLFFVEAKKPSVAVKTDIVPAYQVRRYAWSAKLPISLLTDFEEFAVYDCNKKPKPDDKAAVARIKYLTYNKYLAEFDFLWHTFSKERVLRGSFDKYISADSAKRGTTTVDKDFLQSLDEWRIQLAQNIALRNDSLGVDELNYTVQQTLDRIIFLRIAEDRGVEEYGKMKASLKGDHFYVSLFTYFREADDKYNSGLFDFKKDKLSRNLIIDNKVLKSIITNLYYPASPYEFSVLSVEILGSAYEQFLGKQIRLSDRHKAVIEEKPEVRKAGGVYYTPQYIVDYIVEQTVGKLIEGKTPDAVAKLKIADPACGSGSFLIGAYQRLLTFHLGYYKPEFTRLSETIADATLPTKQREAAVKQRAKLPLTPDGNLTTALKKSILINNIFGVDIDTQAVEVTKLSLLLKCMEGETGSSMTAELSFGQRVLPTLDGNIKSGNSLIDLDFYDGEFDFEPEADKKIKPFSWQAAFPAVFREGGFDVVVGNPPYRLMQPKDTESFILNYFKSRYTIAEFKIDLFHLFFQKGVRILKENGLLGFITPSSLLNNVYVENLREWLLKNSKLKTIALTKEKVFADADVFTSVFVIEKSKNEKENNKNLVQTTFQLERIKNNGDLNYATVLQERFRTNEGKVWNILINEENVKILNKILSNTVRLDTIAQINRGLITGDRDKYFSNEKKSDNYVPILAGSDVYRYYSKDVSEYVFFERPKTSGGCWDKEVHFAPHKILVRQIGFEPTATLIEKPIAVTGNIFTIRANSLDEEKYLLAIINSNLIKYFWKIMFSDFKNSFPQVTIFSLNNIPIKPMKESKQAQELIKSVSTIISLNEQKQQTSLPEKIEQLQHRINYTDNQINKLIYELYELIEDEMRIID